jgi:pSer/pThr/pTyr-binding forkhead associated (FHA) protein
VPLLSVSRRHCELHAEGETLTVKDAGSSNGTYVNNKRVSNAQLKAGDRLVVGAIVFTVQIDGVPEEIHPVKTKGQILAETGSTDLEDIVDLEEDIIGQPGASALEDSAEVDPISALEALAREQDKEKS